MALPTKEEALAAYIVTGLEPAPHIMINKETRKACALGAVIVSRTGYKPEEHRICVPTSVIEKAGFGTEECWGPFGVGFDTCYEGLDRTTHTLPTPREQAAYDLGYDVAEYVLEEIPKYRDLGFTGKAETREEEHVSFATHA